MNRIEILATSLQASILGLTGWILVTLTSVKEDVSRIEQQEINTAANITTINTEMSKRRAWMTEVDKDLVRLQMKYKQLETKGSKDEDSR